MILTDIADPVMSCSRTPRTNTGKSDKKRKEPVPVLIRVPVFVVQDETAVGTCSCRSKPEMILLYHVTMEIHIFS
ncbi:Uncharacterized protein dnm_076670 [Desulfonema magnum]|uniref:Uncharacterized protein n=1 Tax=Desulfonema magnum TaxID=45655 RepID=A0A975BUK7_9BACT|nr:Uncharacterized protein dnm_076670 [Desulfonema magnum]